MLAFRSLDPFRALREPDRRRRDEERLSRSEQRTLSKTQNNHLTGKAPYKFESGFLQRRVSCEPTSRAKKGGLETMASQRGTDGSNPAPATGESRANLKTRLRSCSSTASFAACSSAVVAASSLVTRQSARSVDMARSVAASGGSTSNFSGDEPVAAGDVGAR